MGDVKPRGQEGESLGFWLRPCCSPPGLHTRVAKSCPLPQDGKPGCWDSGLGVLNSRCLFTAIVPGTQAAHWMNEEPVPGVTRPCPGLASANPSLQGTPGSLSRPPGCFPRDLVTRQACAHLCQESGPPSSRPGLLCPLLLPENLKLPVGRCCPGRRPSCPDAQGRPNPPLMTPCPPPAGAEGRGPAQPKLWFLFPLRQASGSGWPACCRAGTEGHSDPCCPSPGTMCSPFRASRSFLPEGELR